MHVILKRIIELNEFHVQSGSVLYSTSQSKRTALFSTVQCKSVKTYSVVQYCTVQVSRNVQWCTVMYSIYQCPVQCGTVFVQCKSVKDSAFWGISVVFETSSVYNQHWPTLNQDQHQDNQHQEKQANKHRNQQAKG